MVKARTATRGRWGARILAKCLLTGSLVLGIAGTSAAAPTAAQVLGFKPRQADVVCATPTEAEQKDCKVELVKGKTGSGWALKDAAGNMVRRFYDTNGDNRIDVWSYYKDGVEVYREVDTTFTGKPDQYRWLNAGGSRWGVDQDRDGTIDAWRVITPEEVSQEVLQALIEKNYNRLAALFISEAELKALELPAADADAVRELRKGSQAKFAATVAKLTRLSPKSTWLHLETLAPQTIPAEEAGPRQDVVRHTRGTVLVDVGGATEWFQTGAMIQVGTAWRLVDAPVPGAVAEEGPSRGGSSSKMEVAPAVQKEVEALTALDTKAPKPSGAGPQPEVVKYHLGRADILEKIVGGVQPKDRDPWIRQVADSLSAAAQVSAKGDTTAMTRLTSLDKQLTGAVPGTNLAAYVNYRLLQADYSVRIAEAKDVNVVQKEWMDRLTGFVSTYPKSDDTPDALLQLGMVCEFLSKDVEAKNWYGQLARNFADKPQAGKAAGAVRRLELEGKPLDLSAPLLQDGTTPFALTQLAGKVVVVYYWASWNGQCDSDFAKLKSLTDANKDVALVAVNLDTAADEARGYLKSKPAPGIHVHNTGGLEGKLATDVGIMVLPSLFLVDKDGKVLSRNAQIATLEDEIKKLKK